MNTIRFTEEEVASSGGKPQNALPPGEYTCRITDVSIKSTQTSEFFVYNMIVVGGPHGGTPIEQKISTSDAARGVHCGWLKACGLQNLSKREVNFLEEPLNKKLIVEMVKDTYNDREFMKVKRWRIFDAEKQADDFPAEKWTMDKQAEKQKAVESPVQDLSQTGEAEKKQTLEKNF